MSEQQVNLSLEGGVEVGDRAWRLPTWNTGWGRFVYPLLAVDGRGRIFPLGTAFHFSRLNHVMTAAHNVEDALKRFHPAADLFVRGGLQAARRFRELSGMSLAILSQGPNPRVGDVTFNIRPVMSVHASPPTDLLIASLMFGEEQAVPWIDFTISFAPPRIGETVYCVGYADMTVPEDGLSLEDIKARRVNPYTSYSHNLTVVEGTVTAAFLKGLSPGYIEGPCFAIDNEVPHGLSGGPILRSDGTVCGVVWAGSARFDTPTTIGSLLYPIFLLRLQFEVTMAHRKFRMTATERPVAELVAFRAIRTDGAEREQIHMSYDPEGIRVGASFHKDDAESIFDDFRAYQEGRSMVPIDGPVMRFVPNPEHPLVKARSAERPAISVAPTASPIMKSG